MTPTARADRDRTAPAERHHGQHQIRDQGHHTARGDLHPAEVGHVREILRPNMISPARLVADADSTESFIVSVILSRADSIGTSPSRR